MVTTEASKKQYKRLLALPFAPKEFAEGKKNPDFRDTWNEYARVMRESCKSDEHLVLVVDRVMNTAATFPAPAVIVSTAGEVNAPDHRGPMGCEACRGSGFVQGERLTKTAAGTYMASYADYCPCEKGQWLKEVHREYHEGRQRAQRVMR